MITVTSKDALRAKVLKPGWKPGTVVSYTPKTAGTDGSALHTWEIEVEDEGLTVPIKDYQVSEKAVSMGKNFFISCGFPKEEWAKLERGEATSYQIDPESCVGKPLKIMVSNTMFAGRTQNEATDFLPRTAEVK